MAAAPTITSVAPSLLSMLLLRFTKPATPSAVLLGLVPKLLLLSRPSAVDPAGTKLPLLLVPAPAESDSSRMGSGQEAVGTCLIRQIRAVSGTLLTGRTSLAKKALISVDLPVEKAGEGLRAVAGRVDEVAEGLWVILAKTVVEHG